MPLLKWLVFRPHGHFFLEGLLIMLRSVYLFAARASLRSLHLLLVAFVFLPFVAASQETTAGLDGAVKDPSGAAISNALIELTGNKLIGSKTLQTDGTGYYHFFNLPPGVYTITATADGFSRIVREGIVLETGRLPTVNLTMEVGTAQTTVEVDTSATAIDVTQSLTQTNVTSELIQSAPRGSSFISALAFVPGARNEPLQGNWAVNGAATSENSYLVEGMDTANLTSGTTQVNIPFEFLQEVPIKTAGVSAEDGGALGGVVNAVQRQGSDHWHGEVLTYYEGDSFDARNGDSIRSNPQIATPSTRQDVPYQFYSPQKDHYRYVQPGVNVGGPLITNRLWAFIATQPDYHSTRRTVNFVGYGPRSFSQDTQQYYSQVRLDAAVTDRIRVYGSWYYGFYRVSGYSLPNQDDLYGLFNSSSTNSPDNYQHGIGYVEPSMQINTGADITVTQHLILTSKYGYSYFNHQDRGLPIGTRYTWNSSGIGVVGLDGNPIPSTSSAYLPNGASNISSNSQQLANQMVRHQFRQDVAWFKGGWIGTHNIKGGYQLNHLYNNVANTYNTGLVELHWGTTYNPLPANQPRCAAIQQQNLQQYGVIDNQGTTVADGTSCMGNYGYADMREYGTIGAAASNNHGFYASDDWLVAKGVTANLGLRVEKEYLPAYDQYPSGISFGWGDKISPRLGAAWDIFQNGKAKLFGSYGVFYDVMKTNLAIDSFGGAYWHNCYYALDSYDYSQIVPQRGADGHYCSGTGEATFAGGQTPSILRFIENQNYRIPSNDPSQGAAVDPGLKPYRQHQFTAGAEYQLSQDWTLSATLVRNRVDNVIEDAGTITPAGETFLIVNPGQGVDRQPVQDCPSCKQQPKAARAYDGLEFMAKRVSRGGWYGQFDYTYSRLRGNYSGLTGSDISDGGINAPRNSPNDSRAFDEPYFQFDSHGRTTNGLLPTDRPHTFKATGLYTLPRISFLRQNSITLGGFQYWYSGTPLTTYMSVGASGGYPVNLEGRGYWVDATADGNGNITFGAPRQRRTPWYVQTDFHFTDEYKISSEHEGWRLGFEANISNLFNRKAGLEYVSQLNSPNKADFLAPANYTTPSGSLNYAVLESPYDYKALSNAQQITLNSQYGQPGLFQTGRQMRLEARFTF
jgi:outer membrane receptor protein involved in Fe transport